MVEDQLQLAQRDRVLDHRLGAAVDVVDHVGAERDV